MLSNGDLVIDTTGVDDLGLYECIAVFSTVGYRNVTLARYNVTLSESHTAGKPVCYVCFLSLLHIIY